MLKGDIINPNVVTGLLGSTAFLLGGGHEGYVRTGSAYEFHFHLLEEPVIRLRSLIGYREGTVIGHGIERHEGSCIGRIGHRTDNDGLRVARTGEGGHNRVVLSRDIRRTHPEHHLQGIVSRHIHSR